MKEEYKSLPYRDNVGVIVLRGDKFLLVQLHEWTDKLWKFPQGGCDTGERPEETAMREFEEELGSKNIKILHKSPLKRIYDFPNEKIEFCGHKWRGQKQTFFIAEFIGKDEDLKPNPDEIKMCKWCSREKLKENILHDDPVFRGYYDYILSVLEEFENHSIQINKV